MYASALLSYRVWRSAFTRRWKTCNIKQINVNKILCWRYVYPKVVQMQCYFNRLVRTFPYALWFLFRFLFFFCFFSLVFLSFVLHIWMEYVRSMCWQILIAIALCRSNKKNLYINVVSKTNIRTNNSLTYIYYTDMILY